MNLDDLKDQVREKLATAWGELQENSTFNTLREKYQGLSANGQKGAQAGLALFVMLVFFYIPYAYFSSSSVAIEDFERNRQMIRSLLEASRNSKLPPPLPPAQDPSSMQSRVQMLLESFRLVPEQIVGIQPLGPNPAGSLVVPAIQQNGISVSLKNLNLTQIMEIGQRLQSIDPGSKMTGLEVNASTEKTNYFNVVFKIVNFSLSVESEPAEDARPGRRGSRGSNR